MVVYPRILSLCTGYGGLDLGLELCFPSCQTVCYVEREAYAAANLVARMEEKDLDSGPIWDDVKTFDGRPWLGAVDCITAGYPCQPFSVAGNQRGADDPRHLWPDIKRIVGEIKPSFCFFENVANHLNMGFDTVSRDLQEMGYTVAATLVTASEVGAPHKRERLFILAVSNDHKKLAHSDGGGRQTEWGEGIQHGERETRWDHINRCDCPELAHTKGERGETNPLPVRSKTKNTELSNGSDSELAHSESEHGRGLQRGSTKPHGRREPTASRKIFPPGQDPDDPSWRNWPHPSFKPGFRRGSYGASKWTDRLRLCGNGVVPLVAAYAFGVLSHDLELHKRREIG